MFFKNRCNITAVLIAGLLGISMVTGLTACGGDDGTKVVFTTGFGKNEVFRIGQRVYAFFMKVKEKRNPCENCATGCELKQLYEKKRLECSDGKKEIKKKCC